MSEADEPREPIRGGGGRASFVRLPSVLQIRSFERLANTAAAAPFFSAESNTLSRPKWDRADAEPNGTPVDTRPALCVASLLRHACSSEQNTLSFSTLRVKRAGDLLRLDARLRRHLMLRSAGTHVSYPTRSSAPLCISPCQNGASRIARRHCVAHTANNGEPVVATTPSPAVGSDRTEQ